MRQVTVVGLVLALAGCATTRPSRSPTPAPATAQSPPATTTTPAPALCIVDGRESSCEDVLRIPSARIESVEVLKGRAAEVLYGSRATAGVVVVTTKP